MFCTQCGNTIPDAARFCTNCGAAVSIKDKETGDQENADISSDEKKPIGPWYQNLQWWHFILIVAFIFLFLSKVSNDLFIFNLAYSIFMIYGIVAGIIKGIRYVGAHRKRARKISK